MALICNHTDVELLSMLKNGDREAFDSIYRRYWLALFDAAHNRLRNRQQAEDLVQDVFFRLWSKRESLGVVHLEAYLRTAIRYEVINFITRKKDIFHFYEPFEALLMENTTPEGQLVAKQLLELVYAYAATLPPKKKQLFILHIKSKLSTADMADLLQISQKTVQNHLGTALQGLKVKLAVVIVAFLAASW